MDWDSEVLTIGDLLKQFLYGCAPEGCGSDEHFIEDDPHRPPIDRERIPLA